MTALTYPLRYPISTISGSETEVTREVTIRLPLAGDLRAIEEASASGLTKSLAMIERLTGLMRLQVDKLDSVDMNAIGDIIADFMTHGPPTGATL